MATISTVTAAQPVKLPDFGERLRGETTEWLDNDTRAFLNSLRQNPYLAGQTVVLGGAGGGIGRKTAIVCAEAGARVFALDVANDIEQSFAEDPQIVGVHCDLTNEAATRQIIKEIAEAYGIQKLGLIAGIYGKRPEEGAACMRDLERYLRVNAVAHDNLYYAAESFLSSKDNADLDPTAFWIISRQVLKPTHRLYGPSKTAQEGVFEVCANAQESAFTEGKTSIRNVAYYPDNLPDTGIWGQTKEEQARNFAASLEKRKVTVEEFMRNPNPVGRVVTSWGVAANIVKDLHPVARIGHGSKIDLSGGFIVRN